MVRFNNQPEEILITPTQQRLRWDIQETTETDEYGTSTFWICNEAIFSNVTEEYLLANKDSIIADPLSYGPYILNGKKT